jgi:hypothetical protein
MGMINLIERGVFGVLLDKRTTSGERARGAEKTTFQYNTANTPAVSFTTFNHTRCPVVQ